MAVDCTNPAGIAAAATCYESCIPIGMQLAVQTFLLAQIAVAVGATATTDPQQLMTLASAQGANFLQTIPPGMQLAVQNYLLCQIANQ